MVASAVCTVTMGAGYVALAALTHPSLRRYAARIGADFVVLDQRSFPARVPVAYEKLQVARLLSQYERVACVDTDIIARPDAPSLFDVVAERDFGVLNELPWFPADARGRIGHACAQVGVPAPAPAWRPRYVQTGVMVLARRHAPLFQPPRRYFLDHPWEQTWLNVLLSRDEVAIHELPWRFNRVGCMDRRLDEARGDSYLIHYAATGPGLAYGFGHALRPGETTTDLVRRDLDAWGSGC